METLESDPGLMCLSTERIEERVPGGEILEGRYQIVRLIGKGGQSHIFEALDQERDELVALKMARWRGDARAARQRLAREAIALSMLDHPGIVSLLGTHLRNAKPFVVLERLHGFSLATALTRGEVGLARALALLDQLSRVLEHLHSRDITHRDLKPENIFVLPGDHLVLVDFELALFHRESAAALGANAPGEALDLMATSPIRAGTPLYMAPEQLLGRPHGQAVDAWSFGVVAHELVTGQTPYRDLEAALQDDLRLDHPALQKLSESLQRLLTRLLDRNPERRPLPEQWAQVRAEHARSAPSKMEIGFSRVVPPEQRREFCRALRRALHERGWPLQIVLARELYEPGSKTSRSRTRMRGPS